MSYKNYLITGGMGLIGSNLAKKIFKKVKNSRLIILDNFTIYIDPIYQAYKDHRQDRFREIIDYKNYRASKSKRVFIERGNAQDSKIVIELLQRYKPEIIFHTAAMPLARLKNAVVKEFREGSVDTTTNLLECVKYVQDNSNYKLKRFLYISSSMVYGDFKKKHVTEDDHCNPKEIYGTMKLAGEVSTKGMCKEYNIPYNIIRPSAVYGPTDMNLRVSQYFIEKAFLKEKISIHGKKESLDFTYIDDLVDGCWLAANSKKGVNETFNITFGKARTLYDYVKILQKYFKDLKYEIKKRDSRRPKRGTLKNDKARKFLGFKPKVNLEKGIKLYLEYFKKKK
ncbi:NAD-dependent epimerase/dehydratase family protein [Pelagibacterales bacterium SAG-MED39]|nr:NAD-dependent epimerase/dehydratase family protein [Pelagibacterales bacterium SAG-MED39]